MYNVYILRVQD